MKNKKIEEGTLGKILGVGTALAVANHFGSGDLHTSGDDHLHDILNGVKDYGKDILKTGATVANRATNVFGIHKAVQKTFDTDPNDVVDFGKKDTDPSTILKPKANNIQFSSTTLEPEEVKNAQSLDENEIKNLKKVKKSQSTPWIDNMIFLKNKRG